MDNEKVEITKRENLAKQQEDQIQAQKCFVENMNNFFDELLETTYFMDGKSLLEIVGKEGEQLKQE